MLRTKSGTEGRSKNEVYRTPRNAIVSLLPRLQGMEHIDYVVDLCAGDGRLGRAMSSHIATQRGMSIPWIGCDIAPIDSEVQPFDVIEFTQWYQAHRDSHATLFVTNPPYGMDRDSNGLYLHDRILAEVADTWCDGDVLLVLYPDLMLASKRRWAHVQHCLGAPSVRYACAFRCAFERHDGTMAQSAQSSISWYQWRAGNKGDAGVNVYLSEAPREK